MSLIPVGSVFVKKPNKVVGGIVTETIPKLNVGEPDTYSEFAGVTVRDGEVVTSSPSVVRLQSTGIGLAIVMGPVTSGDAVGIAKEIVCLAGNPDVAVGIVLQDVAGPVDDPDVKLVRVHFGAGASDAGVILCQITTLFSDASVNVDNIYDYIGVKKWNGTGTPGGVEFKVAKSHPSRTPLSEDIDGVHYTYEYTDDNYRKSHADDGSDDEDQEMCPLFEVGKPIWIAKVSTSLVTDDLYTDTVAGKDIKDMEISTEREWTAHRVEGEKYIDGTPVV